MIRKRIASLDDAAIYKLIIEQLVPFSKAYRDASAPLGLIAIRKRINRNATFVEASGRRAPQGFITFICKGKVLFVDMLAVDPRSQGRGLGRRLMKYAESYGRSKGCTSVQLAVDDSNPKAIAFYLSGGFSVKEYLNQLDCYVLDKPMPREPS
jgi:ribosomal protein S18 acetylase RimI-like enzyme